MSDDDLGPASAIVQDEEKELAILEARFTSAESRKEAALLETKALAKELVDLQRQEDESKVAMLRDQLK